jgi:hypothetical protein
MRLPIAYSYNIVHWIIVTLCILSDNANLVGGDRLNRIADGLCGQDSTIPPGCPWWRQLSFKLRDCHSDSDGPGESLRRAATALDSCRRRPRLAWFKSELAQDSPGGTQPQ